MAITGMNRMEELIIFQNPEQAVEAGYSKKAIVKAIKGVVGWPRHSIVKKKDMICVIKYLLKQMEEAND